MFYQTLSYLKFLLKSTDKHGIHSPFVFDFTANCLCKKQHKAEQIYLDYLSYKNALLIDNTFINITDFGAGSKHFNSNRRKISDIAKYAGISNKKANLLINVLNYFKPNNILELGTSLGLSSLILSQQNRAKVITIEGCKATSNFAQKQLTSLGIHSVNFLNDEFSNILPQLTKEHQFDLVYFDGNHQKKATLNYFNQCLKSTHNETLFIFDDIHLSQAMNESWEQVIKNPKITVSIDVFYFGIVFFRAELTKQHFYIRTNS